MHIWGDPINFRGIRLYPITLVDCEQFYECVGCLLYPKNKIPDARIIKMSYLDFLFVLISDEPEIYNRLCTLLKMVFKEQQFVFTYENDTVCLNVNDIQIDGFAFQELVDLIFNQNSMQKKDEILDPELEKALSDAEAFMLSKNGVSATLEERVITLHCLSHIPYREIKEYTIYQFNKTLERFAIIKDYDTYAALAAELGQSKEVQHWMSHIEQKGRYSDLIVSKNDFDKIVSDEMFKK